MSKPTRRRVSSGILRIEFRELDDGKTEEMRGSNGTASDGDRFKTREREHAGDIACRYCKHGAVGTAVLVSGAHLAFQHDHHEVRLIAFAHDDFADSGAAFVAYGNKPKEILLRKVREDSYIAQLWRRVPRRTMAREYSVMRVLLS